MKISNKKVEWILHPFPHAIIDDFFPDDVFKNISSVKNDEIEDLKRTNLTSLELNKKEFGIAGTSKAFRIPIEIMGMGNGKKLFSKFMPESKIITLASHKDFGGYYPYHQSTRKGLLGAHVDHSNLDGNIHFSNSIFYSHKQWKKEWGGETILFNSTGLKPEVYIEPKPNRMILFIHSNTSFHGVNKILCPDEVIRKTYYMDYYINPSDIPLLNDNIRNSGLKKGLKFTHHTTTFIPFFPLGIKSFKLDSIKTIMFYILNYTKYSLFKFNFISRLRPFFKRFLR